MMGKSILLAGTALSVAMLAMPAAAQEQDQSKQNQTVEQRLKALEDAQTAKDAADQGRATRLSTLEQQFADTVWSFDNARPTVQSADGRFLLSIRARLQFDTAFFGQSPNLNATGNTVAAKDLNSGTTVRRFYLGFEGRAFRDFWYEMRLDLGGSNGDGTNPILNLGRIAWNYGNLAYANQPHFRVNVGVIQPIFTYGDSVSSASTTFMERADVVNAATGAYGGLDPRHGIELTFQQADLFYGGDNLVASAAFTGAPGGAQVAAANVGDEGTQVLGRIAYRLWSDGFSNVQIGASGSLLTNIQGTTPNAIRSVSIQDRPEVRVDGTRLISTAASTLLGTSNTAVNIPESGGSMWGLEGAMNIRNFYLAGEYMNFQVTRATSCGTVNCTPFGGAAGVNPGNPTFSGWYVEGSYMLTGEMKTYSAVATNNEMGTFNNPRIITPFSLDGGWGGWEIAARYSTLDLDWNPGAIGQGLPGTVGGVPVGSVRGGQENITTIGLNWYLNNNVLMRFNYLMVDVNKLGFNTAATPTLVQVGQHVNIIAARLQFTN